MHKRHPSAQAMCFLLTSEPPPGFDIKNFPYSYTRIILLLTSKLGATLELLRQAHDDIEMAGSEGFHDHR